MIETAAENLVSSTDQSDRLSQRLSPVPFQTLRNGSREKRSRSGQTGPSISHIEC